jgi:hypothetical protein
MTEEDLDQYSSNAFRNHLKNTLDASTITDDKVA